ncbi:MAG: hypothetical protein Q7S34_01175 [bacterium]|nr:hypothetical protein [bacterium]
MDFIKSEIKSILIFIVILGGLYLSYKYFFPAQAPLTEVTYSTGQGGEVGSEVLSFLLELKKIRLDQGIFNNPIFEKLKNFSTELGQEPIGRNNPFAPLQSQTALPPKINIGTTTRSN